MEEKEEEFKLDKKTLINAFIIIGIILIIGSFIFIFSQINDANEFCKDQNGKYSIKIFKNKQFCNGDEIAKYSIGGWSFVKDMEVSNEKMS